METTWLCLQILQDPISSAPNDCSITFLSPDRGLKADPPGMFWKAKALSTVHGPFVFAQENKQTKGRQINKCSWMHPAFPEAPLPAWSLPTDTPLPVFVSGLSFTYWYRTFKFHINQDFSTLKYLDMLMLPILLKYFKSTFPQISNFVFQFLTNFSIYVSHFQPHVVYFVFFYAFTGSFSMPSFKHHTILDFLLNFNF